MPTKTRPSCSTPCSIFIAFFCYLMLFGTVCIYAQPIEQDQELQASLQDQDQKRRRSRKGRRKIKEKKSSVTFNNMTYEQLIARKNTLIAEDNIATAIKFLKRILTLCKNANDLADHMIELADLLFKEENYKKAVGIYRDFVKLYPGDSRVEYVLYRAVISSWNCTLSPDRDQTPTHDTIELATEFLTRSDLFTLHKEEVKTIREQCHKKIVESELNVCSFYRDRGQMELMEKRIAMIEEDWRPIFQPTTTMIMAFRDPEATNAISITPALEETADTIRVAQKGKSKRMASRF